LRVLVATYARLRVAFGDAIGRPHLVQPTGEFFPDPFAPDPAGIARLFTRMVSHSPLADDLPVELAFVAGDDEQAGGCGSGACGVASRGHARGGAVQDRGDRYRVTVLASDASNPVLLTTALSRAIGALVLHEGGDADGEVGEVAAEICAAACGFGVLLTAGSEVWTKSCGGIRGIGGTALSVAESATVLALFVAIHEVEAAEARRHLQAAQHEAYDHACAWVESNPLVLDALRERPAWLEGGIFDLEPTRGLIGRWLYKRRVERELRTPVAAAVRPRVALSAERQRHLEEARALVDDAFEKG
jgi:hypothetical protein